MLWINQTPSRTHTSHKPLGCPLIRVKYFTVTIYIIEQSPDNSCPFSTGGKVDNFLPSKVGLIEAGTKGSVCSSTWGSTICFSFGSSGSLLVFKGFVILILIRDGAVGKVAGVESNSTFPSMELFTAAYVVSTVACSLTMLSSGSSKTNSLKNQQNNKHKFY